MTMNQGQWYVCGLQQHATCVSKTCVGKSCHMTEKPKTSASSRAKQLSFHPRLYANCTWCHFIIALCIFFEHCKQHCLCIAFFMIILAFLNSVKLLMVLIVHPELKFCYLFTLMSFQILYDILSSLEHKRRSFE